MNQENSTKLSVDEAQKLIAEVHQHIQQSDYAAAVVLLEQVIKVPEVALEGLTLYGAIAYHTGKLGWAIDMFKRAEEIPGSSTDIPEVLAVLYALAGKLSEALFYGKLATTIEGDGKLFKNLGPDFPSFASVFSEIRETPLAAEGERLLRAGNPEEAIHWLEQHIGLFPRDADALANLAAAQVALGRHRQAVNTLSLARVFAPEHEGLASALGSALIGIGAFSEGEACHRQAISLSDHQVPNWTALISDMKMVPYHWGRELRAEVAALRSMVDKDLADEATAPVAEPHGPTLRIGYMVADLNSVEEQNILAAVIANHSFQGHKVAGFGRGGLNSPSNSVYRNRFDRWTDIDGLDGHTLAAVIRNEHLDVLVDVSGLRSPDQLRAISLRPAPLIVAWFGASHGVGSSAYDYVMVDRRDSELENLGAKAWPLANGTYCFELPFDPPSTDIVEREKIAFGVDGILGQLNADTVAMWSRILTQVPDSELLLMDRDLSNSENVNRLMQLTGAFGIPHRVDVVKADDVADFYDLVDVVLTPFPYARPFSAASALSSGVPVVSLDIEGMVCRDVANLLSRTSTADRMLARSEDEYIAKAVDWAKDAAGRASFRKTIWNELSALDAFDQGAFSASLEDAYLEMKKEKFGA